MVKNNIILAFRQLQRHKLFATINVLGLALSMVACLLIFKYVSFEKSYDTYHEDGDQLYRIYRIAEGESPDDGVASVFPAMTPAIKATVPEVEYMSRFIGHGKIFQSFAFTYNRPDGTSNTFNIPKGLYADDDALKIFTFDWVEGASPSLANPYEIVVSESFAHKFFGQESAVGEILRFRNMKQNFKVTGVFKDTPENTHMKFDVLCSISSLPKQWGLDEVSDRGFGWGNFYTYTKLSKGADIAIVESKINDELSHMDGAWFKDEGVEFKLQKVKDIHLTSHHSFEFEANGNTTTVKFLTIIGIFIMVVAWVNYINLSTSKLVDRAKEVGVRKVLGSHRRQLISQFIVESVLINILAMGASLTILQLSKNFFESLIDIPINFFSSTTILETGVFLLVFTFGSVLFGFYPALLFSKQKVSAALKGRGKASKSGLVLRRALTVFQYATAVILILGTFVVRQQLHYMQGQSLGMNIDQTVIVKNPFIETESRETSRSSFMNQLNQLSSVSAVSASSEIPGYEISRMRWVAVGPGEEDHSVYAKDIAIDDAFVDLYDMDVLYGRSFSKEFGNSPSIVLNLSAARELLGAEDLSSWIGKTIYYETNPVILIGIVGDISQQSLKSSAEAHIYTNANRIKYFSVKLNGGNVQETLGQMEVAFDNSFATSHFDYFFLDQYFDRQYKSDRQFGSIFSFFSVLALIITSLGLLGLATFNMEQRSKEVGVRRVLGASFKSVFYLLTKEYIGLLFLAALIALPAGYFMVDQWLDGFASRTPIYFYIFLLPVVLILVITFVTVGYQVLKAAVVNLADTLRYE